VDVPDTARTNTALWREFSPLWCQRGVKNKFPLLNLARPPRFSVPRTDGTKQIMLRVLLCDNVTITFGFFDNDSIANGTKADPKRSI
jgi:hypothetical protein